VARPSRRKRHRILRLTPPESPPPVLPEDDVGVVRRRADAPAPHSAEVALREHIKLREDCLAAFKGPIMDEVTALLVEGYLLVGEIAHLDKLTIPRAENKAKMHSAKKKIMKLLPKKALIVESLQETLKPVRCPEGKMKDMLKVIDKDTKAAELVPRFEACVHLNGSLLLTLEKAANDFAEYGKIANTSVKEFYKDV
jgi:hypothetical protein